MQVQVQVCDTWLCPFPQDDGSISMQNGLISACLDPLGRLTSLQLLGSGRLCQPDPGPELCHLCQELSLYLCLQCQCL